ncbi:hypothetical protein GE21DRAFT_3791 [Neurospora crassa]|uniref:MOSC domain-containing protein n=1 Tax=Neurospora crassa (strain ATCC 24698 / 74-OR23-1A / CBS 708.71 / DSM 1257 / FGSC 987) TaxID=367110 RepID=A7UXC8_NEUCR|nr:MOSC domain-containing protein [Neurospora crassa OR74A]EDO64916.1 MOSC domain-containing protein [Neurospora crassa OR74A]KHE81015.1 hypothetical protein GE21DRAFT_3791 [Neurospora crassa]|eukprot:XP_001728007.1 MOSC domain-containing protein [Neurospora crassa OR74A]
MKITQVYVYPIKALRPIPLQHAQLTPQGIKYDRTFMLYHVKTKPEADDGSSSTTSTELKKMQLSSYPQCALFEQTILSRDNGQKEVLVKWHAPSLPTEGTGSDGGEELGKELEQAEREKLKRLETETITVELDPPPRIDELEKMEVNLHGSPTTCYKVGEEYDRWFSERFGFEVVFVYLGDGKRQILGTSLLPPATAQQQQQPPGGGGGGGGGWLSTLTSLTSWFPTVPISIQAEREEDRKPKPWITFTDCAPLLITSESSLSNVSARLAPDMDSPSSESTPLQVPMYKMRPNLVLDGEGEEAWAEDYWGELVVTSSSNCSPTNGNANGKTKITKTKLHLTGNCVRCTSLNVDYDTGKPAKGEMGTVLKKLMKDRRVDLGIKWSPVFGRYAFVGESVGDEGDEQEQEEEREEKEPEVRISVGDEVQVTRRNEERTVMDWPF